MQNIFTGPVSTSFEFTRLAYYFEHDKLKILFRSVDFFGLKELTVAKRTSINSFNQATKIVFTLILKGNYALKCELLYTRRLITGICSSLIIRYNFSHK